ncbi:MAG: extracellular solute-binding protein [Candidatus Paceibacterota bacterium]
MNIFRIVILGFFVLFIVVAVLVFSGIFSFGEEGGSAGVGGEVVLWGTIPERTLKAALDQFRLDHSEEFRLSYIEKRAGSFDEELVEALASGRGPDMILLPDELIVRHADKMLPIPYESISLRQFKDSYIEQGELYLRSEGILALPFLVDPMVLYWNRDIFTAEGLAEPLSFWDELFILAPKLTNKQSNFTITRSAIGFGEYQNIFHAKDILALLMIQAGEPIVSFGERGLEPVLGDKHGFVDAPATSALRFYTEFSNSIKDFYSWNRALPLDRDYFTQGNLALYLGYASEFSEIRARNPNLNFDVRRVPQVRDTNQFTTLGKMFGIGIVRTSRNPQTAFFATFLLAQDNVIEKIIDVTHLSPAQRSLLSKARGGAQEEVFDHSALIARSWLDPDPKETEGVFKEMIESVVSGRSSLGQSISRARENLTNLLR